MGTHLYAFFADCIFVKVQDGRLDDVHSGEDGKANVNGIAPLGVQNN